MIPKIRLGFSRDCSICHWNTFNMTFFQWLLWRCPNRVNHSRDREKAIKQAPSVDSAVSLEMRDQAKLQNMLDAVILTAIG